MSIEQTRSKVQSAIWQSLAQSGIDLSSVTLDQQEKLVGIITDNLLVVFNKIMDESAPLEKQPGAENGSSEEILWQGRPFLSMVEAYVITSERLKIIKGLVGRDVEVFELIRLQDIDYKQNLGERMFNIGDINIRGHDPSNPQIVLRNVSDPEAVYEILRKAWMAARKRHGMQFREYM